MVVFIKMENLHKNIYEKLDYFIKNNQIPNIIFHGSSGTGKKTIVYDFLNNIYDNNKNKIKHNVMIVNCSHGKGIKFIREELKFFAKTNIQSNYGVIFKSIVLINADSLTTDAQSALRRCIELFSYNTRFFIIVENKHKLLNPILSRFCEIYVPEYINEKGKIQNLHNYKLNEKFANTDLINKKRTFMLTILQRLMKVSNQATNVSSTLKPSGIQDNKPEYKDLVDISVDIYENGYSCLDLLEVYEESEPSLCLSDDFIGADIKYSNNEGRRPELFNQGREELYMKFHKVKSEFRCEKLLILFMLNQIFSV